MILTCTECGRVRDPGDMYGTLGPPPPKFVLNKELCECGVGDWRFGDWFQTYTGKRFWVFDPRPEDVCIEDVVRSLATTCRFGGHCNEFYSVAQHSVFVSELLAEKFWDHSGRRYAQMVGLLHDAAEAYVGDMVRPIKHSPGMRLGEEFKRLEKAIQKIVYTGLLGEGWNFLPDEPDSVITESVEWADAVALATEKRDVVDPGPGSNKPRWWGMEGVEPHPTRTIFCWEWADAERRFLNEFEELLPLVLPMDERVVSSRA